MGKILEAVQALVQVAAIAVLIAELAGEATGAKGAEKKAQALARMKELLPPERLGGLAWLYEPAANFLIDAIVAFFNSRGFFARSA